MRSKNELIEEYKPFVIMLSKRFADKYPYNKQDLESESLSALCENIDELIDFTDQKRKAYLVYIIRRVCVNYWAFDRTIPLAPNTLKKKLTNGDFNYRPTKNIEPYYKDKSYLEIIETINQLHLNPIEFTVLLMSLQGYNDRQIGELLLYTHQWIHRIKTIIRRKYCDYSTVPIQKRPKSSPWTKTKVSRN